MAVDYVLRCVRHFTAKRVAGGLVAASVAAGVATYAYRDDNGVWRNGDGTAQEVGEVAKPRRATGPRPIREGGPVCWLEAVYTGEGGNWTGLRPYPEYAEAVNPLRSIFDTTNGFPIYDAPPNAVLADGPTTNVPEPMSIALFASGLTSLILLGRKSR